MPSYDKIEENLRANPFRRENVIWQPIHYPKPPGENISRELAA
jgi:hypothetical protein